MDAHCTFSADVSGEVLDRLVALQQIIPDELVQQVLNGSGLIQERSCRLTYRVLLWVVLAMGIYTDSPIRQVFRLTRRFHKEDKIPTRSALCRGRQRLGTRPLVRLAMLAIALQCQPGGTGFYKGYRLMAIDGSVFTIPDTPANEQAFGRPLGGSSAESKGGFPQVGKVSLVEVGSHIEYRFVARSMDRGEPTMALRLVNYWFVASNSG